MDINGRDVIYIYVYMLFLQKGPITFPMVSILKHCEQHEKARQKNILIDFKNIE